MTDEQMLALGLQVVEDYAPDAIEAVARWFDAKGVTPEQMHAALTAAAVARQKLLKEAADLAAFGP